MSVIATKFTYSFEALSLENVATAERRRRERNHPVSDQQRLSNCGGDPTTIECLAYDILVDCVLPRLDLHDIMALSETNRFFNILVHEPSVWHNLFDRDFGKVPNPFTTGNWPELYRARRKTSVYTWGAAEDGVWNTAGDGFWSIPGRGTWSAAGNGRLGYLWDAVEDDKRASLGFMGVCRPKIVKSLDSIVVADLVSGDYFSAFLSAEGRLYGIGEIIQYWRKDFPEDDDDAVPAYSITSPCSIINAPHHLGLENRSRAKILEPSDRHFVSVTAGDSHLLAIDDQGDAWIWTETIGRKGVQLAFGFENSLILTMTSGFYFALLLVKGVGIVWFATTQRQTDGKFLHGRSYDAAMDVDYVVVSGTKDMAIVDICAGHDYAVFLTADGGLYGLSRISNITAAQQAIPVRMRAFEQALIRCNGGSPSATFNRLSGSLCGFAVFSSSDHVFLGEGRALNTDAEPRILPGLQCVGCVSIAMGYEHYLALLRGGTLLSWGQEYAACGVLGLGNCDELLKLGAEGPSGTEGRGTQSRGRQELSEPTPVAVQGTVVAIAAASRHSVAIVLPVEHFLRDLVRF